MSEPSVEDVAREIRNTGGGFEWLTSSEREQIARWALRFRARGVREFAARASGHFDEKWVGDELRRLAMEVTDE